MKDLPLIRDGRLLPAVKILTDYPRDDLASDEVHQALITACAQEGVTPYNLDVGAVPGMDTVTAGFKTAQLALNSDLGFGHIVHTNCAPRRNIIAVKSKGERLVIGMLQNGVALLVVNSGYSLSPFRDLAIAGKIKFFETSVPDSGSQFRSRDYFPRAAAMVARHMQEQTKKLGAAKIAALLKSGKAHELLGGLSLRKGLIRAASIPEFQTGRIWYTDNFGNIKLNLRHNEELLKWHKPGDTLALCIGGHVHDATVGREGFSQGEGTLALTRGSSGWADEKGREFRFTEIFLRGGSAVNSFDQVHHGEMVLAVPRRDLQKTIEIVKKGNFKLRDNLDLYRLPEAQLIKTLARAGLIEDGFDSRNLTKALRGNNLKNYL